MAASILPSDWWPNGFVADATNHLISFTTATHSAPQALPQLTDAKANAGSGDARQILFALADAIYQTWLTRGAANQTTNMRLQRSVSGDSSGNITYAYMQTFTLTPTGIYTIPAEP